MRYQIELTLTREMLGTNPFDPFVMDTHIINKQRQIILEKSKVNKEINKYLDAMTISDERRAEDLHALIAKIEEFTGQQIDSETRALILAGKFESLKETFKSIEDSGTGITVFFWNQEKNLPMIGDHMIYGFMKAASEAIGRTVKSPKRGTALESISYTQSLINQHIRIDERFITFNTDILRHPDGKPEYLQRSLRAETAQGPRITLVKSEVVPEGAKLSFSMRVLNGSVLDDEKLLRKIFDYGEFSGLGQWRNAGFGMFKYTLTKE